MQRRAHHAREIEHAVAHAEGLGWRVDPEAEGYEDRLFEAGCDDATFSFQKGVIIAEFHRKAVTFSAAIASAYEAMLSVGAKVERIEPDHLVSLSEIAERSGLLRQAISLYTRAERGENFPGHSDHPEALLSAVEGPVEEQGLETSFVGLA